MKTKSPQMEKQRLSQCCHVSIFLHDRIWWCSKCHKPYIFEQKTNGKEKEERILEKSRDKLSSALTYFFIYANRISKGEKILPEDQDAGKTVDIIMDILKTSLYTHRKEAMDEKDHLKKWRNKINKLIRSMYIDHPDTVDFERVHCEYDKIMKEIAMRHEPGMVRRLDKRTDGVPFYCA